MRPTSGGGGTGAAGALNRLWRRWRRARLHDVEVSAAALRADLHDAVTRLRTGVDQQLAEAIDGLRRGVEHRLTADETALGARADSLEQQLVEAIDGLRAGVERRLTADEAAMRGLREALERIEREVFAVPYVNPEFDGAGLASSRGFDYARFEQKFRGPAKMLEEKLRVYVPYVAGLAPVIDIGCGRGEFLALLREAGVAATGVDANADHVAECRRQQLDVVHGDLFAHLESLADRSVGAVFSAQVIEHLPWARLTALFALAWRKLRPGGLLIAETVNPHCLAAFKFFWLDPTHVAPLFPEVVQFLAETTGFRDVRIVYPAPGDARRLYHDCGEYAVVARRTP